MPSVILATLMTWLRRKHKQGSATQPLPCTEKKRRILGPDIYTKYTPYQDSAEKADLKIILQ